MPLPEPQPGLVIRYAYLWKREADQGRVEGAKDRPCALVGRVLRGDDEAPLLWVLPITRARPANAHNGVEIPPTTRQRLGLDDEPCWVITTECNQFTWPGPDVRPSGSADFAFGMLPPKLYTIILERVIARARERRLARTDRD